MNTIVPIHIQQNIQFLYPCGLFLPVPLPLQRVFPFLPWHWQAGFSLPPGTAAGFPAPSPVHPPIVHAGNITACIGTQADSMGQMALYRQLVIRMGSIILEGKRKVPVLAKHDRLGAVQGCADIDDRFACIFSFGIAGSQNLHAHKCLRRFWMCLGGGYVLFVAGDPFHLFYSGSWIFPQHQLLQR